MAQKIQPKFGSKRPPASIPAAESSKNRLWVARASLAILTGLVLRILHLTADPPVDLTWSLAPYTDEGAHLMNAKTKLLFNQWSMDEWFFAGLSPVTSGFVYWVFKLFGFGYLPARLAAALAAVGVLTLIFSLLRTAAPNRVAFFGVLLAAISYPWVMQNRLATEETYLAFFLLFALWFWLRPRPKAWQFLAAGLAFGTAVLGVKLLGLFLLPVFFLEFARQRRLVPDSPLHELGWKPLAFFLGGLLPVLLIWIFVIFVPFRERVVPQLAAVTVQSGGGHPDSVAAYLKNLLLLGGRDQLMVRAPLLFLCVFFGMLAWTFNLKEKLRRASPLEFMALLWIIGGLLFLSTMNYHPLRYQTILLPGAFLVGALTLGALWHPEGRMPPVDWKSVLWTVPVLLFFSFNLSVGLDGSVAARPFESHLRRALALTVVAALLLVAWKNFNKNRTAESNLGKAGPLLVFVLLSASSFLDLSRFVRWDQTRTYALVSASRDLRKLPPTSVVAGPWSGAITMETNLRGIVMQNFCNVNQVLERFPVTHLAIFQGGWEQKYFLENYPEVLKQSRLWNTYPLPRGNLFILELPPERR